MTGETLLSAEHVTVKFGGNRVLSEVDIDVRVGEVTGLIGPNGAGKTTLFNVITGMLTPRRRVHRLRRSRREPARHHKRARLGIARTFQRLELFTDLSVRAIFGLRPRSATRGAVSRLAADAVNVARETERVLELVGLTGVADAEVSTIPTGTARLVEVGLR